MLLEVILKIPDDTNHSEHQSPCYTITLKESAWLDSLLPPSWLSAEEAETDARTQGVPALCPPPGSPAVTHQRGQESGAPLRRFLRVSHGPGWEEEGAAFWSQRLGIPP